MKRTTPLARNTPLKQSKILPRKVPMLRKSRPKMTPERKAARGKPCLFNVAGVCRGNNATTVLCHLPWLIGGGMALKVGDACAAHGCQPCHDWIDGRGVPRRDFTLQREADKNFYAARALARMRTLDMEKAA
jgi:hypothetical protein